MPNDFWFRLSAYLSLALSCACLGFAEMELLPEVAVFAGIVIVLLAVSFYLDRRFELSLGKANLLGLSIGILALLWLVWHVANPKKMGPIAALDWPTNMLPVIAPVLMVLIPAKLFRPKHVGDWWALYGVSVAGVALASVMADEPVFVALLVAYAFTTAWSLVLFFYRRGGGFVAPIPNRPAAPLAQMPYGTVAKRPPIALLVRCAIWLASAVLLALPFFLALPRSSQSSWTLSKIKYEVGQSEGSTVELNKTGELTETDEIAYKLRIFYPNGTEKLDLDPETLWRARAYAKYASGSGTWARENDLRLSFLNFEKLMPLTPADLGPEGYTIEFEMGPKEKAPVLAMPLTLMQYRTAARWSSNGLWPFDSVGGLVTTVRNSELKYYQVCGPHPEPGFGTGFELVPNAPTSILTLTQQSEPFIRDFAHELLDRLIEEKVLPATARQKSNATEPTALAQREAIAKAFCHYLQTAPEFQYSTTLTKSDTKLDPVVDFLKNTRSGNCERYAAALTLLLRSLGIPAQFVTGYKGYDYDEDGQPVIRRRHAHAWVEVLVSRPAPPGFPFQKETLPEQRERIWHWYALDPTPGGNANTAPTAKNWFQIAFGSISNFITGYDKNKQAQTLEQLRVAGLRFGPIAIGSIVAAIVARWLLRRWKREQLAKVERQGPVWYTRYLAALAKIGIRPGVAQTPREFAEAVAERLRKFGEAVVEVPAFVTSKLYRMRYAGAPIEPAEEVQIESALVRLEQALAARTP